MPESEALCFSLSFEKDLSLDTGSHGKMLADIASKSEFRSSSIASLEIVAESFGSDDSMLRTSFLALERSLVKWQFK